MLGLTAPTCTYAFVVDFSGRFMDPTIIDGHLQPSCLLTNSVFALPLITGSLAYINAPDCNAVDRFAGIVYSRDRLPYKSLFCIQCPSHVYQSREVYNYFTLCCKKRSNFLNEATLQSQRTADERTLHKISQKGRTWLVKVTSRNFLGS